MKKYLKTFGIPSFSFAKSPVRGTYTAHFYNDDNTKKATTQTWDICIETNGFWYMDSNKNPLVWFNNGSDSYFQAIAKPNSTMSFSLSQINNKLFTGHYIGVMNSISQNMTMTLTYKSATCFYDDPLFEWGVSDYSIQ